jgi:DNA-binding MarR family transcriptional regulator
MSGVESKLGSSAIVDLLDLHDQLCFALCSAKRLIVKRQRRALNALGLTYPQYLVLLVLWEWDRSNMRRPTMVALGERLDLDSGTLTPLLRRLERCQLVTRTTWHRSRRERHIYLTAAGRTLRERAEQVAITMQRNTPLPIGEIAQLRDQINRLRAALEDKERPDDGSQRTSLSIHPSGAGLAMEVVVLRTALGAAE